MRKNIKIFLTFAVCLFLCLSNMMSVILADEIETSSAEVAEYLETDFDVLSGCSDWAAPEIAKAFDLGFVPDELIGKYKEPITRAEFAKVAVMFSAMQYRCSEDDFTGIYVSYYEIDGSRSPFDDCNDSFVLDAKLIGLVNGVGDNRFAPDRSITREESAKMLYNAYVVYSGDGAKIESDPVVSPEDLTVTYADGSTISDWASECVAWVTEVGVMDGVGDGIFSPKSSYTVEQCIATFVRLYEKGEKSIAKDGVSLCPYSPEELLDTLRARFLYHETETTENDLCYVTRGYFSGMTRENTDDIYVVYKTGGMMHIPGPVYKEISAIDKVEFGEDPSVLIVTGRVPTADKTDFIPSTIYVDIFTGEGVNR